MGTLCVYLDRPCMYVSPNRELFTATNWLTKRGQGFSTKVCSSLSCCSSPGAIVEERNKTATTQPVQSFVGNSLALFACWTHSSWRRIISTAVERAEYVGRSLRPFLRKGQERGEVASTMDKAAGAVQPTKCRPLMCKVEAGSPIQNSHLVARICFRPCWELIERPRMWWLALCSI